jgi:hypothetical protein
MAVVDIETPTRRDERTDLRSPPFDARQPAERAETHVHHVEHLAFECFDRVVHIGAHECRAMFEPRPARDVASGVDGGRREVEARDLRPGARPRQGVEPEVTLEMQESQTGDVAERLDVAPARAALVAQPPVDVVEARPDVDRGAVVPIGAVRSETLVHAPGRYRDEHGTRGT